MPVSLELGGKSPLIVSGNCACKTAVAFANTTRDMAGVVSLELGSKSPLVVSVSSDVPHSAQAGGMQPWAATLTVLALHRKKVWSHEGNPTNASPNTGGQERGR